jgi:excisionase family DNA binding protein
LEKTQAQWTPEYLTVGFVAKRCGVSNTTVLRWISTGQLSAFRLPGGHFRIGREDFADFLDKFNMPSDMRRPGNQK